MGVIDDLHREALLAKVLSPTSELGSDPSQSGIGVYACSSRLHAARGMRHCT